MSLHWHQLIELHSTIFIIYIDNNNSNNNFFKTNNNQQSKSLTCLYKKKILEQHPVIYIKGKSTDETNINQSSGHTFFFLS